MWTNWLKHYIRSMFRVYNSTVTAVLKGGPRLPTHLKVACMGQCACMQFCYMCCLLTCLLPHAVSLQNGNTALHEAVAHHRKSTVQVLMSSNCRLNLRNDHSESPMDVARRRDFRDIMNLLSGLDVSRACVFGVVYVFMCVCVHVLLLLANPDLLSHTGL